MKFKSVFFGIIIYCIFSISSVFMKFASLQNNLLYKIILYGISIGILGVFSILWQKMLEKFNLTKAYFFKSTTLLWGVIFGVLIFNEKVSYNMIIGIIITLIGVTIIIGDNEHE